MRITFLNLKSRKKKARGLTLIEIIVIIVVLGVAIPPLLNMWANVAWRSGRSEALADAAFYTQELMEEIKTKRFDENTAAPWSTNLGIDNTTKGLDNVTNETAAARDNWDDIDDFRNATDIPVTGYNRTVNIQYAVLNNTAWQACTTATCGAVTNCTSCNECCYKQVTVSVSGRGLTNDTAMTTIISAH